MFQNKYVICFEGLDASGKETQSKLLEKALPSAKRISFPQYETETGKQIKEYLSNANGESTDLRDHDWQKLQALMTLDRYHAQQKFVDIKEAVIILDRWKLSSYAYGLVEGCSQSWLDEISAGLITPDITFILDIPVSEIAKRKPSKMQDRNESDLNKLEAVRHYYHKIAFEQTSKYQYISGMLSEKDVFANIRISLNARTYCFGCQGNGYDYDPSHGSKKRCNDCKGSGQLINYK